MGRVIYKKQALKSLRRMPPLLQKRIVRELEKIADNPSHYPGDWKPLQGSEFWRLRAGRWRAICAVQSGDVVLLVLKIGPRGDIYK